MDFDFEFEDDELCSPDESFTELEEFDYSDPHPSSAEPISSEASSISTVEKAKTSAPWEEDSTPSLRAKVKDGHEDEIDHTIKMKESPKISDLSSTSLMPLPSLTSAAARPRRCKPRGKNAKFLDYEMCSRAEEMLKEGMNGSQIKQRLGLSQRAVKRLLAQYELYGKVLPSKAHGSPEVVVQREREYVVVEGIIKGLITKNCSITLKHMQKALREQGISKSRSTIHAYLARMRISRKKLQKVPLERNSNNKLIYRQNYCRMIQQIPLHKQVFLDETIFGLQTAGHYGWAPKGEQPKVFLPASRRKHITLLAAVSIRGFEATRLIKGPVTSKHICEFLEHYLDHLEPDEILILDNARMHHAAVVKAKIKELDRPVRYIPAYTPQLNPIENIFSEIKGQYVRLKEDRELKGQDMLRLIEDAIKTMRSKEFSKYYHHYEQWLKKGVAGELFI